MTGSTPHARVLRGDDGAPLDGDRALAIALRWADRPLTIEHLRVGEPNRPLDGVEVKWEGALPVFALADGTRAHVQREPGRWLEAGRRVGLEVGEVLVVETGQLTLEARLMRRSERLVASRSHENTFFGLVVAHTLMISAAVATALAFTPQIEDENIWGASQGILRAVATPWMPLPARRPPPELKERVDATVRASFAERRASTVPQKKRTATEAMRLLMGGGGGFGGGGLGASLAAAVDMLGAGPGASGDGLTGMGARDLGAGMGPGGGPGLGGGDGLPGLRAGPRGPIEFKTGKKSVDLICANCIPVAPGYDRELILKVVRRHQNQIRFCYETELSRDPSLAGKVTVAWTIDATGGVSIAEVAESGLQNPAVEGCIVQRIRSWKFPEPRSGQEVSITFPWVFRAAGQ
jgi:hypothetical protein